MSNELQILNQNAIVTAFSVKGGVNELFERVAQEVRKEVPDITTKKGRDAIGSLAMKVSKSKKIIEDAGKSLVAEQKAQIKLIDDDRIAVVKMFDALRDEILAPRDAWDQAEKDRVAKHENAIQKIKGFANNDFLITANSSMIEGAIAALNDQVIDPSFDEYEEQAKLAKFETIETLRNALTETQALGAERAELERLRQAEQARLQREHEERIAREAAEKATREAEEKARLEAERVQREKLEAEQREARLKAEKEAAELREQALKQKSIDDAKQAEIDRQNVIEAERKRIEQQQKIEAEHQAKLEKKRKEDIEHMRQINNDILSSLMALSLSEDQAKSVIKAIAKNEIPHVSIRY